ncbi:MAG: endonuclease/exonuclease/phosphatase family protein [Oscillospiraceae bacterium]|jgi:endonuclease/exonuclease/phosphatase family metal-dependent hydrolase|nr:endonuclease/exonuclease/phosphatase family protein [Oscillospiraceae bacterium]
MNDKDTTMPEESADAAAFEEATEAMPEESADASAFEEETEALPEELYDAPAAQDEPVPEEPPQADPPAEEAAPEDDSEEASPAGETLDSAQTATLPELPEELLSDESDSSLQLFMTQELPHLEALADAAQPSDEEEILAQEAAEEAAPEKVAKPRKKPRRWVKVVKWVLIVLFVIAFLIGGALTYLTITEYRPAFAEDALRGYVNVTGAYSGKTLRIATFNTGYAALDQSADFFMDGGDGVNPESKETVERNMTGIEDVLSVLDADVLLLQEVDTDSKRSFHIDQWRQYEHDLQDYESRFALNYVCDYVPYPLPTIGKVQSGIATFSRYDISSATRYSLPCPFEWPKRVANLKRCLLVTRIPITGREQELVIVNLHLEAYDDGEGKRAQTEQLMALIEQEYAKGNYVIAGGDFNQRFPGAQYPIKDESLWTPGELGALPRGWQYAYDASSPTCRLLNQPFDENSAQTQFYVIDGFIVSPNVHIVSTETYDLQFLYADHNPVVLEIELAE